MAKPGLSWLLAGLLAAGCGGPPDDSPAQETRERLVGTWLRDYEEDGVKVRRILVLEQDGHFREESRATGAGPEEAGLHGGDASLVCGR